MSNLTVRGNTSGTGTIILESPNTNSNRTITLPDSTSTLASVGNIITLGTAVASTSGTAIDFTGIPSWAKRVSINISTVSVSGSASLRFQLGDSGGIETSGYVGSSSAAYSTLVAAVTFSSGIDLVTHPGSGNGLSGTITFSLIGSNTWAASYMFGSGGGTGSSGTHFGGGIKTLSDTLTQVRVTTTSTDTFDAGTINIMWEG